MLRLDLANAPRWLELVPGVRVEVAPVTTSVIARAQQDVALRFKPQATDATDDAADDAGTAETTSDAVFRVEMVKAVARASILAWEGIGDAAGNPLPVTDAGVDALIELRPLYLAFEAAIVLPALVLVTEGNGSALSPNGTSAAGARTARHATGSAPTAPAAPVAH